LKNTKEDEEEGIHSLVYNHIQVIGHWKIGIKIFMVLTLAFAANPSRAIVK
tara:strand:+ start:35 stop:187 length:153 start_codon:yes stop_codon:yes gene_type:complete